MPAGRGIPALHAEIFAINELFNEFGITVENANDAANTELISRIIVSTVRTTNASVQDGNVVNVPEFRACPNCSRIIRALEGIHVGTGVTNVGQ